MALAVEDGFVVVRSHRRFLGSSGRLGPLCTLGRQHVLDDGESRVRSWRCALVPAVPGRGRLALPRPPLSPVRGGSTAGLWRGAPSSPRESSLFTRLATHRAHGCDLRQWWESLEPEQFACVPRRLASRRWRLSGTFHGVLARRTCRGGSVQRGWLARTRQRLADGLRSFSGWMSPEVVFDPAQDGFGRFLLVTSRRQETFFARV